MQVPLAQLAGTLTAVQLASSELYSKVAPDVATKSASTSSLPFTEASPASGAPFGRKGWTVIAAAGAGPAPTVALAVTASLARPLRPIRANR